MHKPNRNTAMVLNTTIREGIMGKQNGRIIGISAMLTLWFGDINIHVEVV